MEHLGAQRADAEAELANLERDLAARQRAADQRLWAAAREGDLAEIERLGALGADANAPDEEQFGRTALHLSAYHGRAAAAEALVTRLGARLGAASAPLRWTPLHYAAQARGGLCACVCTGGAVFVYVCEGRACDRVCALVSCNLSIL